MYCVRRANDGSKMINFQRTLSTVTGMRRYANFHADDRKRENGLWRGRPRRTRGRAVRVLLADITRAAPEPRPSRRTYARRPPRLSDDTRFHSPTIADPYAISPSVPFRRFPSSVVSRRSRHPRAATRAPRWVINLYLLFLSAKPLDSGDTHLKLGHPKFRPLFGRGPLWINIFYRQFYAYYV